MFFDEARAPFPNLKHRKIVGWLKFQSNPISVGVLQTGKWYEPCWEWAMDSQTVCGRALQLP